MRCAQLCNRVAIVLMELDQSDCFQQRRQGAKVMNCHFDQREKSFSDPSHSLGMPGPDPSLSVFAPWREIFLIKITFLAKVFLGSRMQRNGQLAGFAAAAELHHRHRSFIEMIDRNLRVAKIDGFGHLISDR